MRWPPSERQTFQLVGALLFSIGILKISDRHIAHYAPGVLKLDLRFGYDHAVVTEVLSAFGEGGRGAYLLNLVIDTAFPALAALAVSAMLAHVTPRWWKWLAVFPIAFFVLDFIENIALAAMVLQFPDVSTGLVGWARWVTMAKLSTLPVWVPISLISLGVLLWRRRARHALRAGG